MIVTMIVDLAGANFQTADEEGILSRLAVTLHHKLGTDDLERDWIRRKFRGRWYEEASAGWNWFAYDARNHPVGFATYEQREIKWWWLEKWWDAPGVGIFGPTGVERRLRGKFLGCILTRKALASMQERGFRQAIIPAVGPIEFYERCCGARVIEQLRGHIRT